MSSAELVFSLSIQLQNEIYLLIREIRVNVTGCTPRSYVLCLKEWASQCFKSRTRRDSLHGIEL